MAAPDPAGSRNPLTITVSEFRRPQGLVKVTLRGTGSIKKIEKYFNVEINSILSKGQSLGTLILFKDITQHKRDIQTIKDTQDSLMESERLSSLGQLIGGIAHNLKTPIFSVTGGLEALADLVKEYDGKVIIDQKNRK